MTEQKQQNSMKNGEIYAQYLLISNEDLLIDNAVKTIKDTLKVDESFDLSRFSISETSIEDILLTLYLPPFLSERRLIIVKNLEELSNRDLSGFADKIRNIRTQNCIIMTYRINKGKKAPMNLGGLFPDAKFKTYTPDRQLVHTWITKKVKRDGINLSSSMIRYLEEEFKSDITGLKNEFDKIENYLYEAKSVNSEEMRDLAKGLCDFDKYLLASDFYQGRVVALEHFEELRPYLHSYLEIVYAFTRWLVSRLQTEKKRVEFNNSFIKNTMDEIAVIDKKIKRSSYFVYLMIELFLLTNTNFLRKGDIYGREVA